jgi:hypothetical protein
MVSQRRHYRLSTNTHTAFVWCDSVANRYSNRRECPMLLTTPFDLIIITKRKEVAPHLPVDDAAMLKSGTARLIGCGIISNEITISHEFTSAQPPYFSLHVGLLSCSANIYHPLCGWYMTCSPMYVHVSIPLYVCAHRMIRNWAFFVPSLSTWPTVTICHGGRPPLPLRPAPPHYQVPGSINGIAYRMDENHCCAQRGYVATVRSASGHGGYYITQRAVREGRI